MIFYRLFRYFVFLFLLGGALLFIFRGVFSPFPRIAEAFNGFDAYYRSLDRVERREGDPAKSEEILRQAVETLIQPEQNALDNFLSAPQTMPALNNQVSRGFDTLEALVRSYFVNDPAFKDLVVMGRGLIQYRYENVSVNLDFGVRREIQSEMGALSIETLYTPEYFFDRVKGYASPIAVKWKGEIIYSLSLPSRNFDRSILKTDGENLAPGFGVAQRNDLEILYFYKPVEPFLQAPVFFFIETLPAPRTFNGQALFIACVIVGLILLFIADRAALSFFRNRERRQWRKSQYPLIQNPQTENNLEWLDKVATNDSSEAEQTAPPNPEAPKPSAPKDDELRIGAIIITDEQDNSDQ